MYHLITGPMFAGKTEELQRMIRRQQAAGREVLTIIPARDSRSAGALKSHAGKTYPAVAVAGEADIVALLEERPSVRVVGVDEAQFFSPYLVDVLESLRSKYDVLVAALHRDYQGRVFDTTAALFGAMETAQILTAVCSMCHKDAAYTYRTSGAEGQFVVGGAESYEARCWRHWR